MAHVRVSFPIGMALALCFAEVPAEADDADEAEVEALVLKRPKIQGFMLYLGLGYGTPFGRVRKDFSGMTEDTPDQFPFIVGIGYRPHPLFSFGAKLEYGLLTRKGCEYYADCSASSKYLGLEGRLHFVSGQAFSPWISAGLGYEQLEYSESGENADLTQGPESGRYTLLIRYGGIACDFQAGGDFRITPRVTLGLFLGLRVGTYRSRSTAVSATGSLSGRLAPTAPSGDIPDDARTTHGWRGIGVRGAFTF